MTKNQGSSSLNPILGSVTLLAVVSISSNRITSNICHLKYILSYNPSSSIIKRGQFLTPMSYMVNYYWI
jgi:hypothetical protein